MNTKELRIKLTREVPGLWYEVQSIATEWVKDVETTLDRCAGINTAFPKTFTDPVLGPIELYEWEIMLLDCPLLQRLRGIRQLGMAHTVYNCAVHDRLSHCLGVVEIASRMIQGLQKNADNRRQYGVMRDTDLPDPTSDDRFSIRLAALLHDIGHSSFSHVTESLVKDRTNGEMDRLFEILQNEFEGALRIKTSEAMAVLIILSEPLRRVFEHPRFAVPFTRKDELAQTISARIIGARTYLGASYLTGIISGPVDADKLDYMARDSYFAGLPIGLDVNRLINKLEIITITPDNVPDELLRKRAQESSNQRLYQLGISLSGLTAYEQMIVGRVLLYDRVYYHHKVRCGEAMMRRLFEVAEEERGCPFSVSDLYSNIPDDAMIFLLGGEMKIDALAGGRERAKRLGGAIRIRHFYHRAYAFAERFIAGLEGLDRDDEADMRSSFWMQVYEYFVQTDAQQKIAKEILTLAVELCKQIPEFKKHTEIGLEHVLVDLPEDRVLAPGRILLMRTEGGSLTDANLFFNPEKWSQAYKNQKLCGYVFTPREYIEVIALASQIVFFQKFGAVMRKEAQHLCKIEHLLSSNVSKWLAIVLDNGLCTPECFKGLTETRTTLLRIRDQEIDVPEEWLKMDPTMKERLAQAFFNCLPGGLVKSIHDGVLTALGHLCFVLDAIEKNGTFVRDRRPDEVRELQGELLKLLRARGVVVYEAAAISGGQADIILPENLVLENKVENETNNPEDIKPNAAWQARRYSIALNRRVSFVLIAYKPASEAAILPLPSRVSIHTLEGSPETCAIVRLLVPWGQGIPSKAQAID